MANASLKRLASVRDPGRWIIAALEGVQESTGTGRNDPGWFHPSALADGCDAKLAFRYLGAPALQTIGAKTQRIYDLGHARDIALKRDMARAGVSVIKKEADRKIEIAHLHIRGELDDWVENPISKLQYIIDFKTMRPEYYEKLEAVVPGHHIQMLPYEFAKGVPSGFVIYENKGTQDLKAYPADFNQELWQTMVVNRIERILQGLDQGFVNRNPIGCSTCPFGPNGVCTANRIAELKAESGLFD